MTAQLNRRDTDKFRQLTQEKKHGAVMELNSTSKEENNPYFPMKKSQPISVHLRRCGTSK